MVDKHFCLEGDEPFLKNQVLPTLFSLTYVSFKVCPAVSDHPPKGYSLVMAPSLTVFCSPKFVCLTPI